MEVPPPPPPANFVHANIFSQRQSFSKQLPQAITKVVQHFSLRSRSCTNQPPSNDHSIDQQICFGCRLKPRDINGETIRKKLLVLLQLNISLKPAIHPPFVATCSFR